MDHLEAVAQLSDSQDEQEQDPDWQPRADGQDEDLDQMGIGQLRDGFEVVHEGGREGSVRVVVLRAGGRFVVPPDWQPRADGQDEDLDQMDHDDFDDDDDDEDEDAKTDTGGVEIVSDRWSPWEFAVNMGELTVVTDLELPGEQPRAERSSSSAATDNPDA
jgi:hypothetical protein